MPKCELYSLVDVHQHPTAVFRIDNLLTFTCVYQYIYIYKQGMYFLYHDTLSVRH